MLKINIFRKSLKDSNAKNRSYNELIKIIEEQGVEIKRLQLENQELRSLLKQNSSNSHKPPSSDIYKPPKPQPAFSKTDDEKKTKGGQIGHIGNTLQMVSNPNIYTLLLPEEKICTCCGKPLVNQKLQKSGVKRQVSDIPQMQDMEVTEYERGFIVPQVRDVVKNIMVNFQAKREPMPNMEIG